MTQEESKRIAEGILFDFFIVNPEIIHVPVDGYRRNFV